MDLKKPIDTLVPSQNVLRKARSEAKNRDSLHEDDLVAGYLEGIILRKKDNSLLLPGIARRYDRAKETFVFHNEKQFIAAADIIVLHIDASSGLVRSKPAERKYLVYIFSTKIGEE